MLLLEFETSRQRLAGLCLGRIAQAELRICQQTAETQRGRAKSTLERNVAQVLLQHGQIQPVRRAQPHSARRVILNLHGHSNASLAVEQHANLVRGQRVEEHGELAAVAHQPAHCVPHVLPRHPDLVLTNRVCAETVCELRKPSPISRGPIGRSKY